jgi:putative ATPase
MKELGYNKGYQYTHNSPEAYLPQEYLPDQLRGMELYRPGRFGYEKKIAERLEWWANLKGGGEKREEEEKGVSAGEE